MTFGLELITLEKGKNAGIRPLFEQNRRLGGAYFGISLYTTISQNLYRTVRFELQQLIPCEFSKFQGLQIFLRFSAKNRKSWQTLKLGKFARNHLTKSYKNFQYNRSILPRYN